MLSNLEVTEQEKNLEFMVDRVMKMSIQYSASVKKVNSILQIIKKWTEIKMADIIMSLYKLK